MTKRRKGKDLQPKAGEGTEFVTCLLCGRPFKAIGRSHLVRKHEFDPDHPIMEYKEQFPFARTHSKETLRKLRREIRAHYERIGRRWTRARIRREIRQRAQRGEHLNHKVVLMNAGNLEGAANRFYGSWDGALAAAGFAPEQVRVNRAWSKATVRREILKRRDGGQGLNWGAVLRTDHPLADAARRYFGSWDKAIAAAGGRPKEIRLKRVWTSAQIIQMIRARRRAGGELNWKTVRESSSALLASAENRFGNWTRALKAAGINPVRVRKLREWNRKSVIEAIRRLPHVMKSEEINKVDSGLMKAACRHFGGWVRAVKAAKIDYPVKIKAWRWSPQNILNEIRDRARRGDSLGSLQTHRNAGGLWAAAKREFGGWEAAIEAAGVTPKTAGP